jgi:hypothetical protein
VPWKQPPPGSVYRGRKRNNLRECAMPNDDPDIMTPSDLGNKLIVALRSVSDPQALMQAIADRSSNNLRIELNTKIEAMDKAIVLWHDDLVRVPTDVQKAVQALRDVLQEIILRESSEVDGRLSQKISYNSAEISKLNGVLIEHQKAVTIAFTAQNDRLDSQTKLVGEMVQGRVATLSEVSEERFKSIQTQFILLKQATEQLDLANKTAIAAALQAQKESAGETQKSSQAAIAKSETSTSEAIKALTTTFNVAIAGLTDRYNDLKGRMDRGEGKTSVSDPAVSEGIKQLGGMILDLSKSRDMSAGHSQGISQVTGLMIALGGLAIAAITLFLKHS